MWPARQFSVCSLVIGAGQLVWVPASSCPERDGGAIELEIAPLPGATRVQALLRALDELQAVLACVPQTERKSPCSLQVLISDHWLNLDVLPWSDLLLRHDMASAYLTDGFLTAGHEVATDDIVQVDDRRYDEPCWVARYPEALQAALRYFADSAQCTLLGCQPLSLACIDLLRKREGFTGALGFMEGNWLSLFHATKTSVRPLGYRQFITDSAEVSLAWQRACLCYPGVEAQPLYLLNLGQLAVPETSQIRALRPPWFVPATDVSCNSLLASACQAFNLSHPLTCRPLSRARNVGQKLWISFLVAATLGMLGAVGIVQSQIADQAPNPIPVKASSSDPSQSALKRNEDGNNEVIRRLNLPVDELLRTLVPSSDTLPIWIVSVELDTEASPTVSKVIHLLGQTRGLDEVSAYMKLLSTRAHVGRVDLLRHEIFETDPAKPVRFELEIVWQD